MQKLVFKENGKNQKNVDKFPIPLHNVTNIKKYAFDGCSNISAVYYEGSSEQWAGVAVGSDNGNFNNVVANSLVFNAKENRNSMRSSYKNRSFYWRYR